MGTAKCDFCTATMETKNLKRCSDCKAAFYCSKECQMLHRREGHKAVCALHATWPSQNLRESPDEGEQTDKLSRWVKAWTPVITEATLVPYVEIAKLAPRLERETIDPPPELSGLPRLRCIFFVEDKDDPTKTERARVHSWCVPDLPWVHSHLEKDYSRAIAKQAIPLLVSDINGLKKPGEVNLKFQMMIGAPDVVPAMTTEDCSGNASNNSLGDDDGGLFWQRIEQLLNRSGEGNHGSGS